MKIKRKRWVIVRDGKEILCGLARHYHFRPISEIGDAAIKTYLSKNKAIASFESSWGAEYDGLRYKAVEVAESIESCAFHQIEAQNEL